MTRIPFAKLFGLVWIDFGFCVTGIGIDCWEELADNQFEWDTVCALSFKFELCVCRRSIASKTQVGVGRLSKDLLLRGEFLQI